MSGPARAQNATVIALDTAGGPPALWIGTAAGAVFRTDGRSLRGFRAFPRSGVRTLALASEGGSVLAADAAGAVSVRRAADGAPEDAFACPRPIVQAAIVAPRSYAVVDDRRRGFLHSAGPGGTLAAEPVLGDGTTPAAFDRFGAPADGARLVLLDALRWTGWDRAPNTVGEWHQPVPGSSLMYLDGLVGLSASGGHYFLHWDDCLVYETQTETLVGECGIVHGASAAALSDDGRVLAVGGMEGELVMMAADGGRLASFAPTREEIRSVVVDPAGAVAGWLDREGAFGLVDVAAGVEIVSRASALGALAQVSRRFDPPPPA